MDSIIIWNFNIT